ncbi:MAG: fibronectin type III domain-containing protein [Bacteroidales bacterium]|nr:fibronectin type III domain-containing protein [Bacteroidales bacterium]
MKKYLQMIALVAAMAFPWMAGAQCTDGTPCTFTIAGEDSFGDGWEGSLTIYRNNVQLSTFTVDEDDNTQTFTVCQGDLVRIDWSGNDQYNENTFTITGGDGTVYVSNAHGYTYAPSGTVVSFTACPTCLSPFNLQAGSIMSDGATLSWSDTSNSGASYTLYYWKSGADTTVVSGILDTAYTLTGLDAASGYNFYVVAVCSSSDSSSPTATATFRTDCEGGSCNITVYRTDSYDDSWNGCLINLYQNGSLVAAIDCPSGQSGSTATYQVCDNEPIALVFTRGSYPGEMGGYIQDGGGTTLFSINSMGNYYTGDTLASVADPCPSCLPPTALSIDTVTTDEIGFSWSPRGNATQFAVYLNDSLVDGNVSDTSYSFSYLGANTLYTLGVQAVCSSDDSSTIATIGVRTSCGPTALPFFVDFEDAAYNGAWYPCWDSTIAAGTDPSVNNVRNHTSGGTYGMYLQAKNSEQYNLVVGPEMDLTSGDPINVSFWAYLNGSSRWIKAGVITNPRDTSTFIPLVTVENASGWNEYEFNTSTLTLTDSYRIAWLACYTSSPSSYGTQIGEIDDISVSFYSGCSRPASVQAAANITAHTADLTWESVSGASGYTVYYGTVNNSTDASVQSVTTTDTTVTLTGLNSDTRYYAWVATNCGSTTSDVRPFNYFQTQVSCPAVTGLTVDTTYSDGAIISWHAGGTETAWAVVVDSNDVDVVTDSSYTVSGLDAMTGHTVYVRPICDADDTGAVRSINFATACDASVCNMVVNATDSYGDGWNGNAIEFYQAGILMGSATISSGNSATVSVEVCSSAAVEVRFNKGSYADEMGGTVTDGGGSTVFTISDMSNRSSGDVLATVSVPCPACLPPTNVYLSDTTATGVTIHWTAQEGQSAWIVRVDSIYINVTDTFYTVTTLAERTAHTVGVATDCSGDTSSFASLPFITGCTGGECEITVSTTNDYLSYGSYYSSYSPQLSVRQNGVELASVQSTTETIGVCSNMPLAVVLVSVGSNTPSATIVNGGEEEVFNGTTSSYSAGDTLVLMANACPSCLKPAVQIAAVDSTQLSFTWTVEGGTTYLVSFDNGAYAPVTTGMYTAYGLNPNTLHTFAVKAVCSVGDTSSPRVVNVKTSCGEMAIPYVEGFEGDAVGNEPSCWTVVSAGVNGYPAVDENAHTGSNSLTFESNGSNTAMIASGRIPLPGDSIKVSFWAYTSNGYGTFEAGMMTNPYADSTFISMVTVNASDYTLYEFNTNTLDHDSTYYLAFRYTYSNDYYNANVDDINITLDEGCMTPSNVTATPDNVHPNVTVAWTCAGALNNFVVEYRMDGSDTWSAPQYTTSTSKTVSGLSYSTTYEFRVGQVCGNDTLWSTTVLGTTVCGASALPYVENFVSSTGTLPPCWDYTTPSYFHWNRYTNQAESSGDGEMMAGSGSAGEAAILPTFNVPIVKLQISFNAKLGNISEGDAIMMGAYDESTGTVDWVDTLTIDGQCRESFVRFTYNYLDYTGYGTRIAIGHSHNNPSDWGMAIDSVVVIELSVCNPPQDITVNNNMYPNTADDVYFTWTYSQAGYSVPTQWQLYIDTITSTDVIDSIPESQLITVDTNYYMPPFNTLAEGAHYRLFVRSMCGTGIYSNWVELQNGFATDEYWMNNTGVADTIVGCDFIIYDNGGPVAGYLHNSNSALVIQAGEAGRELQLQGGFFSHGADANTFTVYDGVGTSGTVLYSRTNTNMTETIDSVLATSTTGAMTITFTSGYYAALGYELYIHCVGTASCERPTNIMVEMVDSNTAYATWNATGASLYRVYHHASGDSVWNMNPSYTNSITLSNLPVDVMYDLYVVAYCSATDTSAPSIIRHFSTHWDAPCEVVTNLQASDVTTNSATLSWTSTGTQWELSVIGNGAPVVTTSNPYSLTGLTANTEYKVVVRNVCDSANNRYSEWSDTLTFTTPDAMYTITVVSNNESWGTVTGGGSFANGATTVIKAIANNGYRFVSWQDNDTNAERTITVTGDATYTATFASVNGIDDVTGSNVTLYPNPASAAVTIRGIEGESTVTVVDLNGREVYRANANNSLTIDLAGFAKGAYFVRITGERTTVIRKLVVK